MTIDALTVTHPQRQSETSMKFLILICCAVVAAAKPHVYLYDQVVEMPIDMNGKVIVSPEVARAKAAHLTSDRYIDEKPKIVNMTPLMATQRQRVPTSTLANPGIASYSSHGYDARQSLINQYNQLVQAAELARMRAEYLGMLVQVQAKGAGTTYSASSLPIGYSYEAQAAQHSQAQYVNIVAPIGEQDASSPHHVHPQGSTFANHQISSSPSFNGYSYEAQAAQQTQGFVITKPEEVKSDSNVHSPPNDLYMSSLPQSEPQGANFVATSSSSPSSEGYSYGPPAIQQTQENPVPKPITNEPHYTNLPAPVSEHATFLPQSSSSPSFEGYSYGPPAIQQTQENHVPKPTTNEPHYTNLPGPVSEHATILPQSEPQGANFVATSSSSPSSEGYSYGPPAIQQTQENPVPKPTTNEPHYTNLPAPVGEHSTFLPQSSSSPSSEGYSYGPPAIQQTQENPVPKPTTNEPHYTNLPAPVGEHATILPQSEPQGANFVATSSSSPSSEGYSYGVPAIQQTQENHVPKPITNEPHYTNLPAPVSEHATFLPQSSSSPSFEGYSYGPPAIQQTQENHVPKPITNEPHYTNLPAPVSEHATFLPQSSSSPSFEGYSYGPPAIQQTQENHVPKPTTNEPHYTNLPAPVGEHSTFLPQSSSSPSSEGYSYGVPAIQQTQENPVPKPTTNEPHYTNLPAPVGEHATILPQSEPQGANFVATSSSSPSSEGYSYGVPAIQQTQENHVPKPITNEPHYTNLPAPVSEHATFLPQSSSSPSFEGYSYGPPAIQQTQENPFIKPITKEPHYTNLPAPIGEHATFLPQSEPQGANFATPSSPLEGYSYVATVAHPTENFMPIKVVIAQSGPPTPAYTGPLAPIGEDGRVIDTEEVAKLKSEHLATLAQANAEALALAAKSNSSTTFEEYAYEEPTTQQTQGFAFTKPVVSAPQYTNQAKPQGANFAATSSSSFSSESSPYGTPAIQQMQENPIPKSVEMQPQYTNLPAAIGEQANSFVQAKPQGDNFAATLSPSEGYSYAISQPHYTGPQAPIGEDGRVIDTEEVARVKNNHLAILAQANAHQASTTAQSAASSSSASEMTRDTDLAIRENNSGHQQQTFAIADSPDIVKAQQTYASPVQQQSYDQEVIGSDEVAQSKIQYVAPINRKAETSGATALSSPSSSSFPSSSEELIHPTKLLNREFVPPPFIEKTQGYYGNPTEIPSEMKFRNFHTPTTFGAIAHEPTKNFEGAEVTVQPASLPVDGIGQLSTILPLVPQTRPLNEGARRRSVQRVIRRRPIYDGPLAPLDSAGHVIDTEEVAALKAERLATLDQANLQAIKLANAVKASKATADNVPITYQSVKN